MVLSLSVWVADWSVVFSFVREFSQSLFFRPNFPAFFDLFWHKSRPFKEARGESLRNWQYQPSSPTHFRVRSSDQKSVEENKSTERPPRPNYEPVLTVSTAAKRSLRGAKTKADIVQRVVLAKTSNLWDIHTTSKKSHHTSTRRTKKVVGSHQSRRERETLDPQKQPNEIFKILLP